MSDLVIGEAVVVEMRVARMATRGLGLLIDVLVQALALLLLLVPISIIAGSSSEALSTALVIAATVIVMAGYPTVFETLTRGKSIGKWALGLRVVRDDGGPIRFRHALVRGLCAAFVDLWTTVGVVGLFTSLLNERGKRVGDMLAGTIVIRERSPRENAPTPTMPPQLAGWAPQLELSLLPSDLALAARSYLSRYYELNDATRHAMGVTLADEVSHHVAPAPPAGTPPWAYLAAVLAERHRRALAENGVGEAPPADPATPAAPSASPVPPTSPAPTTPPNPSTPPPHDADSDTGGFAPPA